MRIHHTLYLALITVASPLYGEVVINEIHYDPDVKTEPVEFIELHNRGAAAVGLAGWQVSGGVDYTFPGGSAIEPGSYLVVGEDPAALQAKFGVAAFGPWTGRLSNDGEDILLKNATGGVEDEVDYQLGFPWPMVGEAPGYSIELMNPAFDNELGGNWRASALDSSANASSWELVPRQGFWRYYKGTAEASDPTTLWRSAGFDDTGWSAGQAPIGYGEPSHVVTDLDDMRGNYTGAFLRKTFVVEDPDAVTALLLEASYDDGFKLWINGVNLVNANIYTGEVAITGTAGNALEDLAYRLFVINAPASFLVAGTNILAVQAHNASLNGSSDFWFDARLTAESDPADRGPTPGRKNAVYVTNAPPQIRQVNHSPEQPRGGEDVLITARITDPEDVSGVSLFYQVVSPGNYIELTDPAYTSSWTTIAMMDGGAGGDAMAGDSVYTAVLPAAVQQHRRLVRYRISAVDGIGASVTVPYADDPQPNFAYFCYDGVPAWEGAARPGVTSPVSFDTNVMRRLPAVHLVSRNAAVETATWFERYPGDLYKWSGTLVYDGKVYDHIHYRARGGVHRYGMVKNMWKFDFNRGHDFQMRDDYGRKYDTRWTKLNLGACIQQGWTGFRGEQGMFESVGSRLFSLAGVDSFKTSFLQLRVIDDATEATPDQYEGDFWGLYLAVEQEDGRFLDEHGLPDGNFYKMEGGTGELNNLDPLGPTDKSDLNQILANYNGAGDAWWRANWELESYYSYQAMVQAIHHYDINAGKNYFYYRNPETNRWRIMPWDLDLTWADNMYLASWGGLNELASRILEASAAANNLVLGGSGRPAFRMEFRNRIRELRDLLFNTDQAWQLIDEQARLLRDPGNSPSFLDADRAMWDYNPKMDSSVYSANLGNAGTGRFYQWPDSPGVTKDFDGCVQLMKDYVIARGAILDDLATDSAIPATPTLQYTGVASHPVNGLHFTSSDFIDPQGAGSFAAMEWRVGEVLDTNAPAFDPGDPPPYEITPKWESGEITNFSAALGIPAEALKVGRAYRVRVRMKDDTGRWSHWSEPVQLVTAEPATATALLQHLRVSELMYDPPGGSDLEYIELHNTSTNLTLDLGGAAFTSGVDYNFPGGTTLAPGGYLLVLGHPDPAAFRAAYGLSEGVAVVGPYAGNLGNGGEQLTLKTAPGGTEISSFDYDNGRLWPLAAAGAGHSLVPVDPAAAGQATGALDYPGNWRASAYSGGSPGEADPEPPAATVVLNEIVTHTDYSHPARPEYDSNDWIEFYNAGDATISLAGWYLSDDPAEPAKWAIPAVSIPAGGRLVLNEVDDFHSPITAGFGLDKAGEQVLLAFLPGTASDRVVDSVGFKGQENGSSLSRYPDGAGFWEATPQTSNSVNFAPLPGLRLTEVMYKPLSSGVTDNTRDEYVEIHNPTGSDILMEAVGEAWRLAGGVDYTFPDNTVLPAGGSLVVVSFDPADAVSSNGFVAAYGIATSLRLFGPYAGKLGNRSDRVGLERPQEPDAVGDGYSWVIVDEVVYGNQAPWPGAAAGAGQALTRILLSRHGNDPGNWYAAAPTPGTVTYDQDRDDMPDEWEGAHGLDPLNPADALLDADGDGLTNLDEFLCGSDPGNAGSRFRVVSLRDADISWSSVSGRTYSVYWTPDLHQPFVPIATGLAYPQSNYTDAAYSTTNHGFYSLGVHP